MKKDYIKPYLAVESFQLDAAIAGTCSGDGKMPMNHYPDSCNLEDFGEEVFGSQCGDNVVANPGDQSDAICYQAFQANIKDLFMTS